MAAAGPDRAAAAMSLTWKSASRQRGAEVRSKPRAHALDTARIDYTDALGIPSLRARIARHYRETYGCAVEPSGSSSPPARRARFILGVPVDVRTGRSRSHGRFPAIRRIAISCTALGCEPVLIETSSETRHALTGEALLAAHRKTPLKGVLVGSPANPTGTDDDREALHRLIGGRGRAPASVSSPTKSITASIMRSPRSRPRNCRRTRW